MDDKGFGEKKNVSSGKVTTLFGVKFLEYHCRKKKSFKKLPKGFPALRDFLVQKKERLRCLKMLQLLKRTF